MTGHTVSSKSILGLPYKVFGKDLLHHPGGNIIPTLIQCSTPTDSLDNTAIATSNICRVCNVLEVWDNAFMP